MTEVIRSYVRADEKQYVFIIGRAEAGFAVVETAELWEEPQHDGERMTFFFYPTVFPARRYPTEAQALAAVNDRYPWTRDT